MVYFAVMKRRVIQWIVILVVLGALGVGARCYARRKALEMLAPHVHEFVEICDVDSVRFLLELDETVFLRRRSADPNLLLDPPYIFSWSDSPGDSDHPLYKLGSVLPLHVAVLVQDDEILSLLARKHLGIDTIGAGTPLELAARDGYIQGIRILLDNGADPHLCSFYDGPLLIAAGEGHDESFRLLLRFVDVN